MPVSKSVALYLPVFHPPDPLPPGCSDSRHLYVLHFLFASFSKNREIVRVCSNSGYLCSLAEDVDWMPCMQVS